MLDLNRAPSGTQVVDWAAEAGEWPLSLIANHPSQTTNESTAATPQPKCVCAHRRELLHGRFERDDLSAFAGVPHGDTRRERQLRRRDRGRGGIHGRAAQARE